MEPQNEAQQYPSEQKKKVNISIPAAIITGAVIIALTLFVTFGQRTNTEPQVTQEETTTPESVPAEVAKLRADDYVRGDKNADVLIIEYSDSDCPYCARFHPTLVQAVDEYKGKVAWVYRHFPLTGLHPNAYTEALALECVGQIGGNDKFQNYLDTLINITLNSDPKSNKALIGFAQDEGVSESQLQACMEGDVASDKIDKSINEATNIGAQGTPFSIIVNQKTGKQVIIPGAYPIESIREAIDSLL